MKKKRKKKKNNNKNFNFKRIIKSKLIKTGSSYYQNKSSNKKTLSLTRYDDVDSFFFPISISKNDKLSYNSFVENKSLNKDSGEEDKLIVSDFLYRFSFLFLSSCFSSSSFFPSSFSSSFLPSSFLYSSFLSSFSFSSSKKFPFSFFFLLIIFLFYLN